MAEHYAIVINGYIDHYRARSFEDLEAADLPTGQAVLSGPVANDAEFAPAGSHPGSKRPVHFSMPDVASASTGHPPGLEVAR